MNNDKEQQQLSKETNEQSNEQKKKEYNPVREIMVGLIGGIFLMVVALIVCVFFLGMKIFP